MPTVDAGGSTPEIFFHNFNDGTTGPYDTNVPVGVNITVPDDHTGSGRGKILRIRYADPGPHADINRYLDPDPPSTVSYGSSLYFSGDLYFDNPTANFTNGAVQRKLVYLRNDDGVSFNPQLALHLFGDGLAAEFTANGNIVGSQSTHFAGAIMSVGTWHKLGIGIQVESAAGVPDGFLKFWLDNVLVQQYLSLSMTGPGETRAWKFNRWWVGAQREGTDNAGGAAEFNIDETRYWDNVGFGSTPQAGYHGP